ncbi:DNA repair protein RecN [Plebeiibacterium sediminum]|uniref:DNA repair protein RecN n=1 Tax=Plebeiibacterium sediminum TaxID=2992112 RepID=A0AAE3M513_9BACT|nr:DNA repair protein RecN [Plebeiobacterium sediminum]MCW3787249.1 DNA repair protein RecN [Plebeiobacterium sediminum]
MLKSLFISNYALIDQVEIDFQEGFSVITGETGAGKSIMLGALAMVLGQRSDVSVLKNKEKKSVIEAEFDIKDYGFNALFKEEDVDYEDVTLIRREILTNGKSRAFVNDTPVNQAFLKKIAPLLIDIHSQHQNLLLGDTGFQLNVVDTVAQNKDILEQYKNKYKVLKKLEKEKAELEEQNAKLNADVDYMQFQYNQLDELKLKAGEQEELEQEQELLSHAEEVKGGLFNVVQLFNGDNVPILNSLKESLKSLEKIAPYLSDVEGWKNRIDTAYLDLDDLISEMDAAMDGIEYDPERLQLVSTRLDQIFSLQQKHKVTSVDELIGIKDDLETQLKKISSFDEDLEVKQKEIENALGDLVLVSEKLTKSRKKVLKGIESTITGQLLELGMPNATLKVVCNVLNAYSDSGKDDIEFLFSANKNGELAAIPKVASGGEMSRVMLCIKSLLSISKGLPTIIFDEIDTGVSGEVADKMGKIMQDISNNIQVISITHLPQIAVKGKQHYKVFKKDNKHSTQTSIEVLSTDNRITEVAKMLSGSNLTDAALSNAKDLLGVVN